MNRLHRVLTTVLILAWLAPAAVAVNPANPIPTPIAKDGTTIELVDFVQAPPTGSPDARINYLFHANDGSGRLFFHDMRGKIYIIKDGQLLPTPFLDVKAVRGSNFQETGSNETGVQCFAFHPDYSTPSTPGFGKFYTSHSETTFSGTPDFPIPAGASFTVHHDVVSEWSVDPNNPDIIDPSSRREILRVAQPLTDHTMNQIGFNLTVPDTDPDYGMLYISMGDGGNTGGSNVDQWRTGQDTGNVFGTILRIDPFGNDGVNGEYGIPTDNPFTSPGDPLDEIWAYGLRNPQRFSWDMGGTNRMFIGDIGQAKIEEVNIGMNGFNYGWSEREGTFVVDHGNQNNLFDLPGNDATFGYTYPVAQYDHDEGFAISGGFVYRGQLISALQGKYIFGDLVLGRIFFVDEASLSLGSQATITELTLRHNGQEKTLLQIVGAGRADLRFGQGENGEMYVLTKQDGMIRRMTILNEPILDVQQDSFNVETQVDVDPADDVLDVTNIKQGTLNYTVSEDAPWLSISPLNGSLLASQTDQLTVSYQVAGLSKGTYDATITVEANSWNTPLKIPVQLVIDSVTSDFDGDDDVDLDDYAFLQSCFGPSGVAPVAGCEPAELDGDNDVDAGDLSKLLICFNGADVPVDPTCDD